MEEKIKLIVKELEDLKRKQELDEKQNKAQEEENKKNKAELESQRARLVSMRDVFDPEEEEYQNVNAEVEEMDARIKEVEEIGAKLISDGIDIRNDRAYDSQVAKIEAEKEEVRKELKDRQKFMVRNRKAFVTEMGDLEKEQTRLEKDREAIKRGMAVEEKRVGSNESVLAFQRRQLEKLETKYNENVTRMEYLSGLDIYGEVEQINAMLKELDNITFKNVKGKKDINLAIFGIEEVAEPEVEPIVEPEMEKEPVTVAEPEPTVVSEVEPVVAQKPEVQPEPVAEPEVEPAEEETPTQASTITIEEEENPTVEEPKKAGIDVETKRLAVARALKNNFGIVEGSALYGIVMGAVEANEPIGNLAEFAKKQLQNYKHVNKKGNFDKDIQKLEEEMTRLGMLENSVEMTEEEKAYQELEAKKAEIKNEIYKEYGLEPGDFLYEEIMEKRLNNKEVGDVVALANSMLKKYRQMNTNDTTKGLFYKNIQKLKKEMDKASIPYEDQEEIKKEEAPKVPPRKAPEEDFNRKKYLEELEVARQKDLQQQKEADEFNARLREEDRKKAEALRAAKATRVSQQSQQVEALQPITPQQGAEREANKKELTTVTIGKNIAFKIKTGRQCETGPHTQLVADKGNPLDVIAFDTKFMIEAINSDLNEKFKELDLNVSKEFVDRLDPVVVKFAMKLDEAHDAKGKYLGEYMRYIATRGRKPMSFNIQYDLDELKKTTGIFSKLFGRNKEQQAILENAKKYAKMLQHYEGKNITVWETEKQGFFSKVAKIFKKEEVVKELPILPEERRAFGKMGEYKLDNFVGQNHFKESLRKSIGTLQVSKREPKVQDAKFNKAGEPKVETFADVEKEEVERLTTVGIVDNDELDK